jgi:hypothetical protein
VSRASHRHRVDILLAERARQRAGRVQVVWASDFLTGDLPTFARVVGRDGHVLNTIGLIDGEAYRSFVERARDAATVARGAIRLVFGGLPTVPFKGTSLAYPTVAAFDYRPRSLVQLPKGALHDGEVDALRVIQHHQFTVLRCGRRFGKTTLLVAVICDAVMLGLLVGYYAPVYKLSWPTFNLIRDTLGSISQSNQGKNLIEMDPGPGSVEVLTLEDKNAGRSRSFQLVALDELAFGPPDTETIYTTAVAATLFDREGSRVIAASTPNGINPSNFFWKLCNTREFEFEEYHAPTHANPTLSRTELAKVQKRYHPSVYQQEILANFVDLSGTALFRVSAMLRPDGTPWPAPPTLDVVFSVIDSGIRGGQTHDAHAAVFFGLNIHVDPALYILGWTASEVGAASLEAWFGDVLKQMIGYTETSRLRLDIESVYVEPAGLGEVLLAKFPGETQPIDTKWVSRGKDLRAYDASDAINNGAVRLTLEAYNHECSLKGVERNHLLMQVSQFRIGDKDAHKRADDLLDCVAYGPAIAAVLNNRLGGIWPALRLLDDGVVE